MSTLSCTVLYSGFSLNPAQKTGDGVRVQNAVPRPGPLPKRLSDEKKKKKKPLSHPQFLSPCPAFIQYEAHLVEGGSQLHA